MAKQAPNPPSPETTTSALFADRIEAFRDRKDTQRARRAERHRDKLRHTRKREAKTMRDPRELNMPDPRPAYDPEMDYEVIEARKRYQHFCNVLDGKVSEPSIEEILQQAWNVATNQDLAEVLKGTSMGRIMPDDIIVLKHGVNDFGMWLVLKADASSFTLVAVDIPPYDDEDPDRKDPMNIELKGHPSFAAKCALADMTLELPAAFVTTDLFTRVGWAKPFELDEIMSRLSGSRLGCAWTDFTELQRGHLQTLQRMWAVRQERCIRMAF